MDCRTFIAVEFNPEVKNQIKEIQHRLVEMDVDVKWVHPENIHMTLRFLGETSPKRVKNIVENFTTFFDHIPAFETVLNHLGVFPNPERPRVIWIGASQNTDMLQQLAENIEQGLCRQGIPKEKRSFQAHVTIGRIRSSKNLPALTVAIRNITCPPIKQTIRSILFLKSTLTSQGPIYEPLTRVTLKSTLQGP